MRQSEIDRLRSEVLRKAGLTPQLERAVLHSWELSHVERVRSAEDTFVFKCATEPFTHEHDTLTAARLAGVNVPRLRATVRGATTLGMLMDDLGPPVRHATDEDGITAARTLHSAAAPDFLPPADTNWLGSLPSRALRSLYLLQKERWTDTDDISTTLQEIDRAATARATGTEMRPYGWVHSEFHPESVHVTDDRIYVLDLARAFRGPGLIDLASWHGTIEPPNPETTRAYLEAYVEAGGPSQTMHRRGDLPPRTGLWGGIASGSSNGSSTRHSCGSTTPPTTPTTSGSFAATPTTPPRYSASERSGSDDRPASISTHRR